MFNDSKWIHISYKFNTQSLGNIFKIIAISGIYIKGYRFFQF